MGFVRFLLAFSVLVYHSGVPGKLFVRGDVAVQLFFVISGFYMTAILNTKYQNNNLLFYRNRFLRIYPLYIAVLLVVVAVGFVGQVCFTRSITNWRSIFDAFASGTLNLGSAVLLTLSNLTMLLQDLVMFLRIDNGALVFGDYQSSTPPVFTMMMIPPAWSLSIEIAFYAMAPFLVRSRRRIFVAFALSLGLRFLMHLADITQVPFGDMFFPTQLSIFMLGAASWHFFQSSKSQLVLRYVVPLQIALIFVFLLWGRLFNFGDTEIYVFLVVFALFVPYLYDHYKDNKLDRAVGELSYPFYLTHAVCLTVSLGIADGILKDPVMRKAIALGLATLFTVPLSVLLLRAVQSPFERMRARALSRSMSTQSDR